MGNTGTPRHLQRMAFLHPDLCRNCSLDNLYQLSCGLDWFLLSCLYNMFGNIFCKFIFSVITDDPVQLHLAVTVYNIFRCFILPLIHPHVKRRIFPVSKPSVRFIQLIGRHSQIKNNSVYSGNTSGFQLLHHLAVIASDNRHFLPETRKPFPCCLNCRCILVNSVKMTPIR